MCEILAFTLVFWGLGVDPLRQAFVTSGSSFTTLGFAPPRDLPTDIAAVGEAVVGLGLVALLISFLPSIYAAFQRRELMVSMLQVRGRQPADGGQVDRAAAPDRSVGGPDERPVPAMGGVVRRRRGVAHVPGFTPVLPLAAAAPALAHGIRGGARRRRVAAVDGRRASGSLCRALPAFRLPRTPAHRRLLRRRARPGPSTDGPDQHRPRGVRRGMPTRWPPPASRSRPTSIRRGETSAGWRVNYDTVLVTLAGFFVAPYAPWSSDRSIRFRVRSRTVAKATSALQRLVQFVRPSPTSLAADED